MTFGLALEFSFLSVGFDCGLRSETSYGSIHNFPVKFFLILLK